MSGSVSSPVTELANLKGLRAQQDTLRLGNPSSATLNKVLGA